MPRAEARGEVGGVACWASSEVCWATVGEGTLKATAGLLGLSFGALRFGVWALAWCGAKLLLATPFLEAKQLLAPSNCEEPRLRKSEALS